MAGRENFDKAFFKSKRRRGAKKIEEKDRQFLIEKFVYSVEKENPYTIEKLCSKLKKITAFSGKFISACL